MLIQIEIPDTMLAIPSYSKEDVMLDIAVALYQRKIYSLAKAARFAGINRLEFQKVLSERHVPVFYDFEIDLKTLNDL